MPDLEAGADDRVEIYQDTAGEGRWRRVAPNGETISSGEAFWGLWEARRGAIRANLDLASDRFVFVKEEPKATKPRRARRR